MSDVMTVTQFQRTEPLELLDLINDQAKEILDLRDAWSLLAEIVGNECMSLDMQERAHKLLGWDDNETN